jgi:hypothetical protein
MRMPRCRNASRNALLSYPRSATIFSGRCLGRPRGRATWMISRVRCASRTSARLALSRWNPSGRLWAVDHEHPLGALALPGQADLLATPLGRHERAIEEGHGPLECRERRPPDALPDTFLAPALEPPPRRRRRAILAWQILPTSSRDEDVEDGLDGLSVIRAWASGGCGWWQEGTDEGPLPVSQTNPAHANRLLHPATVSEPPLPKFPAECPWLELWG